ncbi:prephenate dehydrogenase/arogenate dehydrogenase family protein [Gammaproteobacteria bacterium]|jgi:prephenate dehydrogenase|nr:prephenate dehydrogenase/arogenate dehydrogenase family protein [Gammaproteobacteria bacterium]MDC1074698.1 prephenate dehydrogenase/arogenate dehydrogenase family protein [Gammaproteobacteria bacterium]MDC3351277.1 prephenate dehydrogenase/arogenate dehydrogenase family protein [Gammaproteobacteria bacterium]
MTNPAQEILIIGLGLIGSSLAKATKNKGLVVHGYDLDQTTLVKATDNKIIDKAFESLEEINNMELIGKIDLIIVAVSPRVTQSVISSLKSLWNTDITITETSSVKNHLNFDSPNNLVFSHPIAGSDKSGISALDENLFTNKKTIICNPYDAKEDHINKVINFWQHALSMRVSEMTVKEHDLLFAMTSHLPHLISYALIDSIRLSSTEAGDNAGGGLKEFIRLSGSNPEMWKDIFELNEKNIIKSLASFQLSINNLLELITKIKEIPSTFSHSDMLKSELDEIKKYKEDTF